MILNCDLDSRKLQINGFVLSCRNCIEVQCLRVKKLYTVTVIIAIADNLKPLFYDIYAKLYENLINMTTRFFL